MKKENYKSQTKLVSGVGFRIEIGTDANDFADLCAACSIPCSSSCRYFCRNYAEKCADAEIVADAEPRAETFAERHAVVLADVRAENRLNRAFCLIDVTYCISLVQIWLEKVQNCVDASVQVLVQYTVQMNMPKFVQFFVQILVQIVVQKQICRGGCGISRSCRIRGNSM